MPVTADNPSDTTARALMLALATAALGHSLQMGNGILVPGAMPWLAAALIVCVVAVLAPLPRIAGRISQNATAIVLAGCIAWQVYSLLTELPYNDPDPANYEPRAFRALISVAAALMLVAMFFRVKVATAIFPATLALLAVAGAQIIAAAPTPANPPIDVFVFQQDSCRALMAGTNPYSITFPDEIGETWYAPGVVRDGRLQFGFPYMPLTLLTTLPGYLIAGDVRYSHLAAILASAALIAYARPSRLSFAAAAILLFQPRSFYILERSWCEPQVVVLLSATVFVAFRAPRYLGVLAGLLVVSKQYMLAAAALTPLLIPVWDRKKLLSFAGEAGVVALVATLPLAALALPGFWRSAVALQFRQPYRWDSLSFPAWIGGGFYSGSDALLRASPTPAWLPFAVLAIMLVLCLWRCARTPAGFAAAIAASYFCFFAFGKQAFANYYYFVIGAMCCAIGSMQPAGEA